MKLADAFHSFLSKKPASSETYLSLFLDEHQVIAAFWRQGTGGRVQQIASGRKVIEKNEWKDRTAAVDALLGQLEEKTKISDVTTTILGFSGGFLTPTGEIRKDVRAEIKKLSQDLDLTIAGFVPLTQAIIFKLKTDEGVPPSVILLGVNTQTLAVSLYKIGTLVGVRDLEKQEDVATELEHGLKSFTELEVLPARILLFGPDAKDLEDIKTKLMHHAWSHKANFLHFPKIEIVSTELIIDAISLAGASEMTQAASSNEDEDTETTEAQASVPPPPGSLEPEEISEEVETLSAEAVVEEVLDQEENVVMVDAASLGFKKDTDILEETLVKDSFLTNMQAAVTMIFQTLKRFVTRIKIPKGIHPGIVGVVLVIGIVLSLIFWSIPKAAITVLAIPKTVTAESAVTLDPTSTVVTDTLIAPARTREQSVTGEKTIAVVGKKNIGDPAIGTVTIYNKSLASRTFKKGAVITTGSLKFALNTDVEVASASESVGSITFGKKDVAVTAVAIGTQSNIAANQEFTIADISSSVAIARNESALTGGTSREVTVVSRADYDAFIKTLSEELTVKAQDQLSAEVAGGEQMIAETIKTTVTEKKFDQEIDQEATELHGTLTITVSGLTYSQSDIRSLLTTSGSMAIPDGYRLDEDNTTQTLTKIQAKKDGTFTAVATMEAKALPIIDVASLPKQLAGKTIKYTETYLRSLPGVGGMQIRFRFNPFKSRMPINRKNITVTMSQVE